MHYFLNAGAMTLEEQLTSGIFTMIGTIVAAIISIIAVSVKERKRIERVDDHVSNVKEHVGMVNTSVRDVKNDTKNIEHVDKTANRIEGAVQKILESNIRREALDQSLKNDLPKASEMTASIETLYRIIQDQQSTIRDLEREREALQHQLQKTSRQHSRDEMEYER